MGTRVDRILSASHVICGVVDSKNLVLEYEALENAHSVSVFVGDIIRLWCTGETGVEVVLELLHKVLQAVVSKSK